MIEIKSCNSEQLTALQEVVKYWSSRGGDSKLEKFTENNVLSLLNVICGNYVVQKAYFPNNEWKEEPPNLNVGDVCLSKYQHTVGKADHQLCKGVEAEKDARKLVGTRDEKEELPGDSADSIIGQT